MKRNLIIVLFALVSVFVVILSRGESGLMVSPISRITISPIDHPDVIRVEEMIDKTGADVPPDTKKKVAIAIAEHSRYYGIKPKSLVAIAFVESTFQPNLINTSGDHGLMQINWPTWKNRFTRDPKDLLNVYKNVEVACKIININKSMGQTDLAAYHSFNAENKAEYAAKLKEVLRRL